MIFDYLSISLIYFVINENLSAQIETLLLAYLDSEGVLPVKLGDYLYIKGQSDGKDSRRVSTFPSPSIALLMAKPLHNQELTGIKLDTFLKNAILNPQK